MKIKRKVKKITLLIILLVIIIMTLIMGKSYSKYTNQVQGQGQIKIANWSFTVNGQTSNITNINLAQSYNPNSLNDNTIAPGTQVDFDIVIDATGSDVGVQYTVQFENETQKPSNLKFTYDGTTVNSIKELEPLLIGEILQSDNEKIKILKIQWSWQYETGENKEQIDNNDKVDTEEAQILKNYKFDVVVEGVQIMPQKNEI